MELYEIQNAVTKIAVHYPVISIDLFGSYVNDEASEKFDVDLLVYFDEKIASLFDFIGLKQDIEEEINKKVDIVAGPLDKNSLLTIKKKVRIYRTNLINQRSNFHGGA